MLHFRSAPHPTWTDVKNKGYLWSRGIDTPQKPYADEEKIAVNELFDHFEGPPDAVVYAASMVDPQDMWCLW